MASLDEYLDAVAGFLRSVPDGPARDDAGAEVFQRVVRMIGSVRLSFAQAATANQKTASIGFSQERIQELSSKILEATQRSAATADAERRRPMQDWTALSAYLTEAHWAILADKAQSEVVKVETILVHCLALGLQTPSEITFQYLTAMLGLANLGAHGLQTMPANIRHELLKAVKMHFKRAQVRHSFAGPFVVALPASPQEFALAYPSWYTAAFGDSHPAPTKLTTQEILTATRLIPMRSSRADAGQQVQLAPPAQVPMISLGGVEHGLGQQANQFMMSMFQQMQQMQQVQAATLHVLQRIAGTSSIAEAPMAMAKPAVADAMPAIRRVEAQLALDHSSALVAPPLTAAASHVRPLMLMGKSPADEHLESAQNTTPASSSSSKPVPKSAADATAAVQAAMAGRLAGKVAGDGKLSKAAAKQTKGKQTKSQPLPGKHVKQGGAQKAKHEHKGEGKPPSISLERSRSQFLCRTGFHGPGQTKTITFNSCGGEAKAKKKAEAWLTKTKKDRGIK